MDHAEIQSPGALWLSGCGMASGESSTVPNDNQPQDAVPVLVESPPVAALPFDSALPVTCRACGGETGLAPIHQVWTEEAYRFWRCRDCGSETSDRQYTVADYDCDNRDDYFLDRLGSWKNVLDQLSTNVWLFEKNVPSLSGRRFLDVGYCDGAMLQRMRECCCECYGFDVFPNKAAKIADRAGVPLTSLRHGPDLWSCFQYDTFDLIQCREVIEHVPCPCQLFRQMSSLLRTGGLLAVQTPTPSGSNSRIPYQIQHLCLINPFVLRVMGMTLGLKVKDQLFWTDGQAMVFEKQ